MRIWIATGLSICLIGGVAVAAPPISAAAPEKSTSLKIELPVEKYTLENGLTVLLLEDHRVPVISYHTWYKVGSKDEEEGITGSAHMLEHMMFQGAKKYTGKEMHRLMDENGISWNAFTTYDYTGFYMNLPSNKLELVMDIEFDRMSSLTLDEAHFVRERDVVKEERRMRVDNNPQGLLWELSMSTFFKTSPYRWPVIGWMKDIEKFDVPTMRKYYQQYYGPNNAVLVIAGDFQPAKVKKMVQKYYGALPARPVPPRVNAQEPMRTTHASAQIKKDVQSATFYLSFPGAKVDSPDMYALDMASTILGSGTSSRLHRDLVYRKQTATSAGAGHYSLQDSGIFMTFVTMKPGQAAGEARRVVAQEIARLRAEKVSEADLKKAKTIVMKSHIEGLMTMDAKARALAESEIMTGSYKSLFDGLEKYDQVTAEDIQRVAQKYLQAKASVFVMLEPEKGALAQPQPQKPAAGQGGAQ